MHNLLKEDLNYCVTRLPKDVYDLLKKEKNKLFLAGGFIRAKIAREDASDIDIFSTSMQFAEICADKLKKDGDIFVKTDNAFTVCCKGRLSVQFIHKWAFDEPKDDFTVAKAVIWFNGLRWDSLCDERFYPDLAAKRLIYTSPKRIEEVGGSMLRVLKFYQRGYRIPLEDLGFVIARLVSGISSRDNQTEEDVALILSGLLREVDPLTEPN